MKQCTKCKEFKSKKEFCKNKKTKDGLHPWCKECKKQYYEENKEQKKQYYEENKESIAKRMRQYRKENKETLAEYMRQYRKENKEDIAEQMKQYHKSKALFNTYAHQINCVEDIRYDPEDSKYLQVVCTKCKEWINPTNLEVRRRITALNSTNGSENRFYCSDECKKDCDIYGRIKYPKDFVEKNDIYRNTSEYRKWRAEVYDKDKYTCRKCNNVGGNLEAHHIFSYSNNPNLRFVVSNGITFCIRCHTRFHSIFGKGNNNREQLEKFLD